MLRFHHHSACYCYVKLVGCQWICTLLGVDVDVDLIGRVVVGLGGTYGCRCGILYASVFWLLYYVRLTNQLTPQVEKLFWTVLCWFSSGSYFLGAAFVL